jgi:hypothetical protein
MTKEIERKLKEVLGMGKKFEEITKDEAKMDTLQITEQFKKRTRLNSVLFGIKFLLGWVLIAFGVICLLHNTEVIYINSPTIIIVGVIIIITAKQGWRIAQSKLTILQEIKQFELRITEILKKNSHP